jgi:hypothetical protein
LGARHASSFLGDLPLAGKITRKRGVFNRGMGAAVEEDIRESPTHLV